MKDQSEGRENTTTAEFVVSVCFLRQEDSRVLTEADPDQDVLIIVGMSRN